MKRFGSIFICLLFTATVFAQSTRQDFPTPVVRDEISASIPARDIGDARLTQHFYTFYANSGDLFLEIETANLNGDVDVFEAATLRPLSKISLYAESAATTTNRIIYFRKRERVVLRVEGRTPNDDGARYRIKFSGGFVAATDLPAPPEDLEPKVSAPASSEAVAKVNSAGAIIEIITPKKPEPEETPQTEPAVAAETSAAEREETVAEEKPAPAARPNRTTTATRRNAPRRRAATTSPRRTLPTPTETDEPSATETPETVKPETTATTTARRTTPRRTPTTRRRAPARRTTPARRNAPAAEPPAPDPLASVRLVVLLKDGYKIERPMSEILRVNVDKDQLVVIAKDGKIERFALLDVQKMSIEQ